MANARKSKWEFVTSNGGNIGIAIVAAEGGSITLREPGTRREVKFGYGAVGIGLSFGVKLPKLGRFDIPGAAVSSESMPSEGMVCMSTQFPRSELKASDFEGGCTFLEASGGLAWGHSGYVFTFGMSPALFVSGLARSELMPEAIRSAKGYILFHGWNFGLQAGIGGSSFTGLMEEV